MAKPAAVWADGSAYEPYVGRWSRLVAQQFLAWLRRADGAAWLDVGCGTGPLSETVLTAADPAALLGVDPSPGFVATRGHSSPTRAPGSWSPMPAGCPCPTTGSTPW